MTTREFLRRVNRRKAFHEFLCLLGTILGITIFVNYFTGNNIPGFIGDLITYTGVILGPMISLASILIFETIRNTRYPKNGTKLVYNSYLDTSILLRFLAVMEFFSGVALLVCNMKKIIPEPSNSFFETIDIFIAYGFIFGPAMILLSVYTYVEALPAEKVR